MKDKLTNTLDIIIVTKKSNDELSAKEIDVCHICIYNRK